MKILKASYKIYLKIIKEKLTEANFKENPAEWLFKNDLRTPFFMLQAIARIVDGVYGFKQNSKLKVDFKLIEDQLGKMDFYNQCLESFKKTNSKDELINFYEEKINLELEIFKKIIYGKNWLNNKKILKIDLFLKEKNWLEEKKEIKKIKEFYIKSIKDIRKAIEDKNYNFKDIETNIHELRRKLRWLSIYIKATNGVFKIVDVKNESLEIKKYLTKEILNSPHTQPTIGLKINKNINIDKTNFLALSWLINELGKLKDKGLLEKEINNANTNKTQKEIDALDKGLKAILLEAQKIVLEFNKDAILENLVIKLDV